MQNFKNFLINEEKSHLGHRVNDVLSGMEDVQKDMDNLGSRHLNNMASNLVIQIRKILHSQWSPRNAKHLKQLQKIAGVLAVTIDEKGDLKELLPKVVKATQQIAGQLGVKVNNLQAPELGDIQDSDFQPTPQQPQQPQQPAPGAAPTPPMPPTPGAAPAPGAAPTPPIPGAPPAAMSRW